jgi:hypothetical protein
MAKTRRHDRQYFDLLWRGGLYGGEAAAGSTATPAAIHRRRVGTDYLRGGDGDVFRFNQIPTLPGARDIICVLTG